MENCCFPGYKRCSLCYELIRQEECQQHIIICQDQNSVSSILIHQVFYYFDLKKKQE